MSNISPTNDKINLAYKNLKEFEIDLDRFYKERKQQSHNMQNAIVVCGIYMATFLVCSVLASVLFFAWKLSN